jgi:hypothetical protein
MTALSASLGWVAPNLVSYYNDFWVSTMSRRQSIYFFCVCLFALRIQAYDTNMDMDVVSGNVCYFRHYVPNLYWIVETCNYKLSADCIGFALIWCNYNPLIVFLLNCCSYDPYNCSLWLLKCP